MELEGPIRNSSVVQAGDDDGLEFSFRSSVGKKW